MGWVALLWQHGVWVPRDSDLRKQGRHTWHFYDLINWACRHTVSLPLQSQACPGPNGEKQTPLLSGSNVSVTVSEGQVGREILWTPSIESTVCQNIITRRGGRRRKRSRNHCRHRHHLWWPRPTPLHVNQLWKWTLSALSPTSLETLRETLLCALCSEFMPWGSEFFPPSTACWKWKC